MSVIEKYTCPKCGSVIRLDSRATKMLHKINCTECETGLSINGKYSPNMQNGKKVHYMHKSLLN